MEKAASIDISNIDTGSAEFQNALRLIQFTSQSVFLTGKAGTGKSTFLRYLTQTTKKKYVVLAPTGIAAVNAGGQTIHSFFKLPFKPMLPDDPDLAPHRLRERLKYNKEKVKLLRSLDLIIIDEVSMVRADTIDFIDRILRVYCGNPRQPFGGKQLLLVGDVFQLEPVITGDIRDVLCNGYRDGMFFFNAKAFSNLSIVPIELNKVFRQNDDGFIKMLDRIRVGSPLASDIDMLNSKVKSESEADASEGFTMTIASRRDIVDRINEDELAKIKRPKRTFIGNIEGQFPENSLPTDRELVLKEGAQVVFVKNDMEKRWVNGTIGRIVDFGDAEIKVETADGAKHSVEVERWENVVYEYDEEKKKVIEKVIGSYDQYPLKLAWAITIHKSQGLTFDRVVIDVGHGAFSGGQTYVALSRCRSLDGITLRSTLNARDIFVNPRVVEFSRHFNDNALIEAALEHAKADDYYHRAARAFDKGDTATAVNFFAQAVCSRNELSQPEVVRLLRMKLSRLGELTERCARLQAKIDADRERFLKLATEYVEMGETCREEGWEMQAAVANYDKAIMLCPDYTLAWLCKGKALAAMDETDEALACFIKAGELDKSDFRGLLEAGRLMLAAGDVGVGMSYLLASLDRNGKIAETHLALAEGYEKVGDDTNATAHKKLAKKYAKRK